MTATATRKAPRKTTSRKKSWTPKTPEQKEAERAEAHDRLVKAVETLDTAEGWANYLRAGKYLFGKYSTNNTLLILMQCPEATVVGGFKFWINMGRCPNKGEGIKIYGFTEVEEIDPLTGEVEKIQRFPIKQVWDIQNTRVVDEELWAKWSAKLPTGPATRPEGTAPVLLTGEDETHIGDRVAEYMRGNGWTVVDERITGGANGYTRPADKKVAVRDDVSPAQRAKTLIHEAGHIECGHVTDMAEYVLHRGRMECEAEGTAYVVGDALGLDTSAYSIGYLDGWAKGDVQMIRETAETVLKAARAILKGVEVEEEEDAE